MSAKYIPRITKIILIASLLVSSNFTFAAQSPWQSKVDAELLAIAPGAQAEFIIFLSGKADLSGAAGLKTKEEKARYVYERLTQAAGRTQPAMLAALSKLGVEARPYWIANMIWVRGDLGAIQAMAQRADVRHIYANPTVRFEEPVQDTQGEPPGSLQSAGVPWNIQKVNAPAVWAAGFTGQGVVIGGQDTGYNWNHPALKDKYRGWNGTTADHNYNWHDAVHSGGGICGADSKEPCDDHGHGTHTMGTMVGDDGAGNQVGMAPGARWIGCRNMDQGLGSPTTYAECYQWFLAPTDANGKNPRPDLAPDIINNSWGCPAYEGCTQPDVLLEAVNNVRAAGILTVHSAGNEGSACSSVASPSAIYDASFTVGATDDSDKIAGFSSRGPVLVDGSGRLKPDISAPGVNIRSSAAGGGFTNLSGTSMSSPHVAGLAALVLSANPSLDGQPDAIEALIEQNAVPLTSNDSCGTAGAIPNNTFGWGRVDALIFSLPFRVSKTSSATQVRPGDVLTYTLEVTSQNIPAPVHNIVLTDTLPSNTTFITATLPHAFDGSTIRWDFPVLEANTSIRADLVVQVSADASGMIVNALYGAASDENPAPVHETPLSIPVLREYDLTLTEGQASWAWPGKTQTYTHTLTNTGASSDSYSLSLDSSQGWSVLEPTSDVTLAPEESALITVNVSIPEDAGTGSLETATLTVTSRGGPLRPSASVADTTLVTYPEFFPMWFR